MKILGIIGAIVGALGFVLLLAIGIARFQDGPMGFFPGGPLEAGELGTVPDDWAFVDEIETIEMQLEEPPRSRTTWVIHHDGSAYIPCGIPHFRLWKQWPHQALENDRAIVRIDGTLYPVRLTKLDQATAPADFEAVATGVSEKYGTPKIEDPDQLWIFRLDPRR